MIFMVFRIAERESSRRSLSVLVIGPLKSLVSDQIGQMEGSCTAVELLAENISRALEEPAKFIYSSPNKCWKNAFLLLSKI